MRVGWLAGAAFALASGLGVYADEKADALIRESREATARIQTLQADLSMKLGDRTITGKVIARRPNLLRLEMKGYPMELVVSDGKTRYSYFPEGKEYQKGDAPEKPGGIAPPWVQPVRAFLDPTTIAEGPADALRTYKGLETVGGREYEVIEVVYPKPSESTTRWYISPQDKLVHRVQILPNDPEALRITAELSNVRAGGAIAADAFAWTPPADAKLFTPRTLADLEKQLVPVGQPAPSFDLPTADGARLSLEQAAMGKKAVLINFWFYG